MPVRTKLHAPTADTDVLRKSAAVYARGRTPQMTPEGEMVELDVRPGGPGLAARHLREISATHGVGVLRRAVDGLQMTRGNRFVVETFAADPGLQQLIGRTRPPAAGVAPALRSNETGLEVPEAVRDQFREATGHAVDGVRLHSNPVSYEAADSVSARAFTVGRRIYFGRGEYAPNTEAGRELLLHELVHTVQQRDATMPAPESLEVSVAGDAHERQADAVARSVMHAPTAANDTEQTDRVVAATDISVGGPVRTACVQRVINFATAVGTFTPHNIRADEDAAGFVLTSTVGTFQWEPEVTISGDAGDVFTDWETAHHQVGKAFWMNVWWGTGTDRTHRVRDIDGGLPMRDATAAGNTWYSDWRAQGFAASGDVRSPVLRDTPSTGTIPWANPVAGRGGTRGWFNYGFGFVATLSARHIPDGTGAAAFRHLNHVHWNFSVDGTFDTTNAVGSRVTLSGGTINRSGMITGIDSSNPPMHGGPIINDRFRDTTT